MDKLNSFETAYGSKWMDMMEVQLKIFNTKQTANEAVSNQVNANLWAD